MKLQKGDFIIALFVLVLALTAYLPFFASASGDHLVVAISESGKQVIRYDLSHTQKVTLPLADGRCVLVIEDGATRMERSDCPDQICVHTGCISRAGQSIVCLPNQVSVRIESSPDAEVDAISGGVG